MSFPGLTDRKCRLMRRPANGEDSECKISERSSDPVAWVSSHGQSSEASAGSEGAADSKAVRPSCLKSQTQPVPKVVPNSTEPRLGTVSNNHVLEEEQSRRINAGLCRICGGQKYTGKGERCLIGWTYKKPAACRIIQAPCLYEWQFRLQQQERP